MKKILLVVVITLFSVHVIQAQKTEKKKEAKEKVYVKLKEGAKPDIYVDGKKYDFPLELIDQNKIESVSVFKDAKSVKKYNAPNGVILIKTKAFKKNSVTEIKIKESGSDYSKNAPMVIINGKVSTKKDMEKLSPDKIKNINILKGKQAIKKYNAPNGVIIITTK